MGWKIVKQTKKVNSYIRTNHSYLIPVMYVTWYVSKTKKYEYL